MEEEQKDIRHLKNYIKITDAGKAFDKNQHP